MVLRPWTLSIIKSRAREVRVLPTELKLKVKAAPGSPTDPVCLRPSARSAAAACVADTAEEPAVAEATFLKPPPVLDQSVAVAGVSVGVAVVPRALAVAPVRTDQFAGSPEPIELKSWV